MRKGSGLFLNRRDPVWVRISERVDPDSAAEIDIGFALGVGEGRPPAAFNGNVKPAVGLHQRGVLIPNNIAKTHMLISTSVGPSCFYINSLLISSPVFSER